MKERPDSPRDDGGAPAIQDRWVDGAGDGELQARAGALLRQAMRPAPLETTRLAAVRARLRRDVRRPQRHWALRLAIAIVLVLSGSALTAAAQLYFHLLGPARPAAPEARTPPPSPRRARTAGGRAPRVALAPDPGAPTETEAAAPIDDPPLPAPPAETAATAPAAAAPAATAPAAAAPAAAPARPRSLAVTPPATPAAPAPGAPADVTPPPAQPAAESASALAQESALLAAALRRLRNDGDARGALAMLVDHDLRFGTGALAPEATLARIEALLALRRNDDALRLLDRTAPSPLGRGRDLLIARAELRAAAGRCAAATGDFDLLLTGDLAFDAAAERALWGRASCRAGAGDAPGARRDLQDYLARFPNGRFARDARAALGS